MCACGSSCSSSSPRARDPDRRLPVLQLGRRARPEGHDRRRHPPPATEGPGEIWQALTKNAAFRAAFDARAAALLADRGPLGPTAAAALYEQRIAEVESAILLESARWGDNQRPAEPYTKANWAAELEQLRSDWFPRRTGIVREQLGVR